MAAQNNDNNAVVIVDIQADTSNLQGALQEVQQQLQDTAEAGEGIIPANAAKPLDEVKKKLEESKKKLEDLVKAGRENTDEYKKAKEELDKLVDSQKELNAKTQEVDKLGKLEGFVKVASGGAAIVGGMAASLTLFGIESEDAAKSMARLQALMALGQAFQGILDIAEGLKQWKETAKAAKEAQQALTTAQEGTTVATKAGTVAGRVFGTVLKGIGIGLIVAALGYLIANFDKIKASIQSILPAGVDLGKTFDKIKSMVVGVGSAVVQWVISPFKVVYALFTKGMKAAVQEFKNGINVVKNYQDGFAEQEKSNADSRDKDATKKELESTKREIERKQKRGEAVKNELIRQDAIERKILLKGWDEKDEVQKQREDRLDAIAGEKAAKAKAASDAAVAKRKADAEALKAKNKAELEELKKGKDETSKVLLQSAMSDRIKEVDELTRAFNDKKKKYEKYGLDTVELTKLYNQQVAAVNDKYNATSQKVIDEYNKRQLDEYDKKIEAIKAKYAEARKNATPEDFETLTGNEQKELDEVSFEKDLSKDSNQENQNLAETKRQNVVGDKDTPEAKLQKQMNILTAERAAEFASYQLQQQQARDNADALTKIDSDHKDAIAALDAAELENKKQLAEAQKEIEKKKGDNLRDGLASAANSLQAFAEAAGEQTVAGKAMAVASAGISTALSAQQAFTAMSGIPIVGPALGAVAAAAAVVTGIMNIKKILAVKVPGKGNGGISVPAIATASAPTVSAAAGSGAQDVRVINKEGEQPLVRAYITDKDLSDNAKNSDFMNNLSTLG